MHEDQEDENLIKTLYLGIIFLIAFEYANNV